MLKIALLKALVGDQNLTRKIGRNGRPRPPEVPRRRLAKCSYKLRSLMRLIGIANKAQRKSPAQGVILSRLHQHLEVISMGKRADLASLQRMQNRVMRWVRGEVMRAFRKEAALESLSWLDVGQTTAKAAIMSALKVLHESNKA